MPTDIYTLSLHDALPICPQLEVTRALRVTLLSSAGCCPQCRSEEHTSELQSPDHLVCRLLLEKKKNVIKSSLERHLTASTRANCLSNEVMCTAQMSIKCT